MWERDLMKEAGEVISQFNRFVICRSHTKAKTLLGETLYSKEGIPLGTVVDIFGPVERPYLKIVKKNGVQARTLYYKE